MELQVHRYRQNSFMKFVNDFRAIFIKTFLLTIRRPGQTIAEILVAYVFMALLLGMRYIIDRRYNTPYQVAAFRPQDMLSISAGSNITYYYPGLFDQ